MGFSPDAGDPVPGLMRTFRLSERKARELEQTVPRIVKRRVPRSKGEKIAAALRRIGADVMVRPARHSQSMMAAVAPPEARAPAMSVMSPEESIPPGGSGPPGTSLPPAGSQFPVDSMAPAPPEEPQEYIPPEESVPDRRGPAFADVQAVRRRQAATRIAGSTSPSQPPLGALDQGDSSAPPPIAPARPPLPDIPKPSVLPVEARANSPEAWELDTTQPSGSGRAVSSGPPGDSDVPLPSDAPGPSGIPAGPSSVQVPIVVPRAPRDDIAMELDGPVRSAAQPPTSATARGPQRLPTPAGGSTVPTLASSAAPRPPAPSSGEWLGAALLFAVGGGFTALRLWRGQSVFYGNGGWLFGAWLDALFLATMVVGGWRLFAGLVLKHDSEMAADASKRMAWFVFPLAVLINYWGPFEPKRGFDEAGGTVDQRIAARGGKADACLDTALTDESCADCCDSNYEMTDGDCLCDVPIRCLEGNKGVSECRACCQKELGRPARGVVFTSEHGCICDANRTLIE